MKKNFNLKMKMVFLLLTLMPFIGMSQAKNVISTNRVFPKVDKVLEFEKALANHAQKYHTGDVKWRVFDIQSGPDAGGYHIVEGPKSWESEDSRGDISAAHNTDWHKGVTPFLTDKSTTGYSVYIDSLSTVAIGDYSDKVQIQHLYPKPGCGAKVISMIDHLKEVWAADGYTVAVYSSSSSGPTQYAIATRYKQGLKERASGFHKSFIGIYEKKFGSGSWAIFNDNIREYTDGNWSELISFRADLSSK